MAKLLDWLLGKLKERLSPPRAMVDTSGGQVTKVVAFGRLPFCSSLAGDWQSLEMRSGSPWAWSFSSCPESSGAGD